MKVPARGYLLHRLDEARSKIEKILPKIDPIKEIYPGWTIREVLVHMCGWDDATIVCLRAQVAGHSPATPADQGVDAYNNLILSSHQNQDFEHVIKEWKLTRQLLRTTIEHLPEQEYSNLVIVPWGEKISMTDLVEIFHDHEERHVQEIRAWLKDPENKLIKKGK